MQTDIDIEEIRGLLEKAHKIYLYYGVSNFTERVAEIKQLIGEALSLLPKPCSTCGGSGRKKEKLSGGCPCPDCQPVFKAVPCPTCQAPASEIEELLKEIIAEKTEEMKHKTSPAMAKWHLQKYYDALSHLTALLKRVEELEAADWPALVYKATVEIKTLQAKVAQLEGEKKGLKDEINRVHGRVVGRQKLKEHGIEYED